MKSEKGTVEFKVDEEERFFLSVVIEFLKVNGFKSELVDLDIFKTLDLAFVNDMISLACEKQEFHAAMVFSYFKKASNINYLGKKLASANEREDKDDINKYSCLAKEAERELMKIMLEFKILGISAQQFYKGLDGSNFHWEMMRTRRLQRG